MMTVEGLVAENEARTLRNQERSARRAAGEAGVDADEVMLELTPHGTGHNGQQPGPPPPIPEPMPASLMEAMKKGGEEARIAAFAWAMSMVGSARDKALEVLGNIYKHTPKDESKKTGSGLLQEGPEPVDDAATPDWQLDCRLITLVKLGFHLPLTLCTNTAIELVQETPTLLVCKSQTDADSNKVTVVDPTNGWPRENTISSEEWKDAWANFLRVLPSILPASGVARFQAHFDFLQGQKNFLGRFAGILKFDMKIRYHYFWAGSCIPFSVDSLSYLLEFNQIRTDVSDAQKRQRNSSPPRREQYHDRNDRNDRDRFERHDRNDRNDRNDDHNDRRDQYVQNDRRDNGGGDKSFRGGRSHASAAPLCLVCAGSGHRQLLL